MPNKLTTEEFLRRAKLVHGDTYDYSQSVCTGSHNKLTIICREHGAFEQVAKSHMSGSGCMKCGFLRSATAIALNQNKFIERALAVHGSRYNYSKCVYTRAHNQVIIICKEHGEFRQAAYSHLNGRGCRECSNISNGLVKRTSVDELVDKFNEVHGAGNYDYSNVRYKDNKTKIAIICKKHGLFKQIPSDHLRGIGCPRCGYERVKEANSVNAPGWGINSWIKASKTSNRFDSFKLYLVLCGDDKTGEYFLKLGRTFLEVKKRFEDFPYRWKEVYTFSSDAKTVYDAENKLKQKYKDLKSVPSTRFGGMEECFSIAALDSLMTEFEKLNSHVQR